MQKIACVGNLSVDFYITQQRYFAGGTSLQIANHLKSYGFPTDLYSAVGNDFFGQALYNYLHAHSTLSGKLSKYTGQTTMQKILLSEHGDVKIENYKLGIMEIFARDWLPNESEDYDVIHVQLADGIERIFEKVANYRFSGLKILDFSINPASRGGLANTLPQSSSKFNLIFLHGTEAQLEFIKSLAVSNPKKTFVVTLKNRNVHCFTGEDELIQSAFSVKNLVDPTGYEAAFQAGFIAYWLKSPNNIDLALKAGAEKACRTIQQLGGTNLELITLT